MEAVLVQGVRRLIHYIERIDMYMSKTKHKVSRSKMLQQDLSQTSIQEQIKNLQITTQATKKKESIKKGRK